MKKFYALTFLVACLGLCCPQTQAVEATATTQQQTPMQATPANQGDQQKTGNRDIILDQVKKNCDDLAKVIESLDGQLRSEEFLNQNITIVELSELINRVQEDIKTRINELDRNDKVEILKIIKEKEQALLKQVKDMEILLRPQKATSSWKKKVLIASEIVAGVALAFTLLLATYDNHHDTWSLPSWENVRYNFALLFDLDVTTPPTPIRPRPAAGTPPDKAPHKEAPSEESEEGDKDSEPDSADSHTKDDASEESDGHTESPSPAGSDIHADIPAPVPGTEPRAGDNAGSHADIPAPRPIPLPEPRAGGPTGEGPGGHVDAPTGHDNVPDGTPSSGGTRSWYNPGRYIWGVKR